MLLQVHPTPALEVMCMNHQLTDEPGSKAAECWNTLQALMLDNPTCFTAASETSLMEEVAPNSAPAVWYFYNDKMKRTGTGYSTLSARCLSMVRPGIDYVVLPNKNTAIGDNLACALAQKQGFSRDQIIWINTDSLEDTYEMHTEVLASVTAQVPDHRELVFVPWAVTPKFLIAISAFNTNQPASDNFSSRCYRCFGDCLTTTVSKSWLHPRSDPADGQSVPRPSSYRHGIRVPRGYCFSTAAGLRRAHDLLREGGVQGKLYFKPAFTSGGNGITSISSVEDLLTIDIDAALKAAFLEVGGVSDEVKAEYGFSEENNPPFILEEGITAAPGLASPVLQALGDTVLPCCDQVMNGMKHGGNVFPSRLPEHVQDRCRASFQKLQAVLSNQRGFYGVDFVIEEGTLEPVLVDLNMARPNGNHYFQLFRDSLPVRPPVWSGRRANFQRAVEQGIDYSVIMRMLREAGIALDFATGVGVAMIQVSLNVSSSIYTTKVFVGARTVEEFETLNAAVDTLIRQSNSAGV